MHTSYKSIITGSVALFALSMASYSSAQTAQDEDEIVVTGIRASLTKALDFKRDSNQVVDSISAEDVGKFPDKNIADALQRITGVAIDRSGGEGRFITVRGLGPEFNTVLVNGRTMATDNDGREFSFDILSSEIISRADVYKSPTARLQEGGIGATVDIVTARPLTLQSGFHGSASIGGVYNSLSDDVGPDLSGTLSYVNDDKTFGVVVGGSYIDRDSQQDVARIDGFIFGNQNTILGDENSTNLTNADQAALTGIHTPRNLVFERDFSSRERFSLNGTVQASLSDKLEVTVDGLYSSFDVDSVATLITPFFTQPFIGIETNANNTVTGFNRPGQDFLANNPGLGIGLSQNDNVVTSNGRKSESYQIGGNVKFDVTEDFKLTADVSVSHAERRENPAFVVIGSLATTAPRFNLNPQNDIPEITNQGVLDDPLQLRHHFSQQRRRFLDDDIFEARLEGDWAVDKGPLQEISVGALFSERDKVFVNQRTPASVRCAFCGYNLAIDPSIVTPITFDNFLNAASGAPTPVGFTYDPFAVLDFLGQASTLSNRQRQPGLSDAEFAASTAALLARGPDPFRADTEPGSSFDVTEQVSSAFINTVFGGDFGGELPWTLNVGARLSQTDVTSVGQDQQIISITQAAGDDLLIFDFTPLVDVRVDSSYTNFLPSANLKLDIDEDKILRFAVASTVTRPTLTSLGTNNEFQGRVTNALSSGGNPELEPFESTNYDAAFEWYYNDSSFFGLTAFHKEFTNFLESQTLPEVRQFTDANGVVSPITFEDTRVRNGEEGSITGFEVALQHSFEGALDGFGVLTNYTYVDSDVQRAEGSAAEECDYNGLSPHTFNVTGFYEKNRIQARASYNWRDEFLLQCFSNASRPRNQEAFGQLDFSIGYDVTDNLQLFVDGVNLFDADIQQFSVVQERFLRYEDTGSRFTFGVRGRF